MVINSIVIVSFQKWDRLHIINDYWIKYAEESVHICVKVSTVIRKDAILLSKHLLRYSAHGFLEVLGIGEARLYNLLTMSSIIETPA